MNVYDFYITPDEYRQAALMLINKVFRNGGYGKDVYSRY